MRDELDKKLCEKYPKLFKNRYASMQETCMCWGFECGDGWYNILAALCANIQHHVDWQRKKRAHAIRYNRALKRALKGDQVDLIHYHSYQGKVTANTMTMVLADVERASFRIEPLTCEQVVVEQVKEKFGTLRFYYTGGDDEIHAMVRMAESMSEVTCEECGNPGELMGNTWFKTRCQAHIKT